MTHASRTRSGPGPGAGRRERPQGGVVALKIDVATRRGLLAGVPRLLALLQEFGVRASFFLTFGPEDPGDGWRARRPWPRPRVALEAPDLVQRIALEGHEVGLRGWDARLWRTRLHELDDAAIGEQLELAFEAYERVFGVAPRAASAPGWRATGASLRVQDGLDLLYASDLRDGAPGRPVLDGYASTTLQLPSNRPLLLEILARGFELPGHWVDALLGDDEPLRVLPLSAEVEGLLGRDFLHLLLVRLRGDGLRTATLAELAEPLLALERGAGRARSVAQPLAGAAGAPLHSMAPPGRK